MSDWSDLFPLNYSRDNSLDPFPNIVDSVDLRREFNNLVLGSNGETPIGKSYILRRMRRDSEGSLVPCICVHPLTKEADRDYPCSHCVLPNTKVLTQDGVRNIQDILPGMKVLNGEGEYHSVLNTYGRIYQGNIVELRYFGRGDDLPLEVTADHLIAVYRPSNFCNKKKSFGKFCHPDLCYGHNCSEKNETFNPIVEYVRADAVKKGDFLVMPRPPFGTKNNEYSFLQVDWRIYKASFGKENWKELPSEIRIDPDLMTFLGWYVAEGSGDSPGRKSRGVIFSLHKRYERGVAENLLRIAKEKFGLSGSIVEAKNKNSLQVVICSALLSRWMHFLCGRYSDHKRIPSFVWDQSESLQQVFLRAFMDGDGHKNAGNWETTGIVSWNLAEEIGLLARTVGYLPVIYFRPAFIGSSGQSHADAWYITWKASSEDDPHQQQTRWRYRFLYNDFVFSCVKSVKTRFDISAVYDLTMDGDPSFVANGVKIHNCLGNGNLWDEELILLYEVVAAAPGGSNSADNFHKMNIGTASLPASRFFLPYNLNPKREDRLVELELDVDGSPTIPYIRIAVYELMLVRAMRSDAGKIDFWVCSGQKMGPSTKGHIG